VALFMKEVGALRAQRVTYVGERGELQGRECDGFISQIDMMSILQFYRRTILGDQSVLRAPGRFSRVGRDPWEAPKLRKNEKAYSNKQTSDPGWVA